MNRIVDVSYPDIFPFDIEKVENIIEYSSISKKLTVDSQTPKIDILKQIIPSPLSPNNFAETAVINNEDKDSTNTKTDALVPVEVESMAILASMLRNEYFESGIINQSEIYFLELLQKDPVAALNGLNLLFMNNFSLEGCRANILIGILHILSHVKYTTVYPCGQMMAISALTHMNKEVAEYGIKCFENWEHPDGVNKLRAVRFSAKWLQDYANEVIKDLSEGD